MAIALMFVLWLFAILGALFAGSLILMVVDVLFLADSTVEKKGLEE